MFLFRARKYSEGFDTHVRLIVRPAYQETCVTINDDGKVDCGGSTTRGRDDHHISVRVLEMLRGDGNGEEERVFFLQPTAGNKKMVEKKKRKEKTHRAGPQSLVGLTSGVSE